MELATRFLGLGGLLLDVMLKPESESDISIGDALESLRRTRLGDILECGCGVVVAGCVCVFIGGT